MNKSKELLTPNEVQRVEWGEALDKDYFYLPVIYYSEQSADYEEYWYSLRFSDETPSTSLLTYVSKVPKGHTLWQAVRQDLETDFHYPHDKSFAIEGAKPFDKVQTKDGRILTRLLVWVDVNEKFDTSIISPMGTKPEWFGEGENLFNPIGKYFD